MFGLSTQSSLAEDLATSFHFVRAGLPRTAILRSSGSRNANTRIFRGSVELFVAGAETSAVYIFWQNSTQP